MLALYAQARVGDSGVHLGAVRAMNPPAHLWHGLQVYSRAVDACIADLRRKAEDARNS